MYFNKWKKRFIKIAKYSLFSVLGLISFVLFYLLLAFVFSRWEVNKNAIAGADDGKPIQIFILSNGVHTDIVLPVKNIHCDWRKDIPCENTMSKDSTAEWLAFGWGNKGFYLETPTWADLKFSTAFKAAFGLSSSAIHATYYHQMKQNDNCKSITIRPSQYKILEQFIKLSFKYDKLGQTSHIRTNANYCNMDAFYEAKGSYSLFNTCNTWANTVLKKAGLRACLWTPFDKGIFYHYR